MSERFAQAAADLCRFAAVQLGWRPDEFWRATPADLLGSVPLAEAAGDPPSRADIARMMEEERHE